MEVEANTMVVKLFCYRCIKSTVTHLRIYKVICQLYLNKARKKIWISNKQQILFSLRTRQIGMSGILFALDSICDNPYLWNRVCNWAQP